MKEIAERYKDAKDVVCVAVQTVFEGFEANPPAKSWQCAKKYGLTIPFGHDGKDGVRSKIFADYRAGGTPWTVIIDGKGIVRTNDFFIDPAEAEKQIESLREESKSAK